MNVRFTNKKTEIRESIFVSQKAEDIMETKKSIGFGFRGWLLIIVLFFGFMMFQVFTNYPLNILADFYGGAEKVAMLMTIGTGIGIVLQIVISNFIGKIKSIKKLTAGRFIFIVFQCTNHSIIRTVLC